MAHERIDDFEGVRFSYSGDVLMSAAYGEWPFPIEDGTLGYPGGYPLHEALLDQVVGKGRTGRELNDSMSTAREICAEAYPRYLASLSSGS